MTNHVDDLFQPLFTQLPDRTDRAQHGVGKQSGNRLASWRLQYAAAENRIRLLFADCSITESFLQCLPLLVKIGLIDKIGPLRKKRRRNKDRGGHITIELHHGN
ncbi:hypothetical protein D3C87_1221240 [compost metagenome]